MTISYCNSDQFRKCSLWIAPLVIISLLLSVLVYAETSGEKPVNDRIALESDKAIINRAERIIELEGNVKVSQGQTVITSNLVKLFLKEGASLDAPQKTGENAIEKIVATGTVIFKLDIGTAYSDRAEYAAATKLLVLTGKEAKFISGENTITGSKITVNRENGMVIFEGGGKSRVEAVIYSKEKL
ncbi:MAG: LptA/OstA family protein [Pseudomonadota bacterium]